jgi:hypothetical protein
MTLLCRAPYCTEEVAGAFDVCAMCWEYRDHWLDPMPLLWRRAHIACSPSGSTAYAERISAARPGPSIPLRTGPLMAMETALTFMTMWADAFIRRGLVGHLPERGTIRDEYLFVRAVTLCAGHDHTFTGGPLAGDYYLDIYRAHWALCRVDNARADTVRMADPCPACDRLTLVERNAGEYGQCLTCGRKWTQAALSREIHGAG